MAEASTKLQLNRWIARHSALVALCLALFTPGCSHPEEPIQIPPAELPNLVLHDMVLDYTPGVASGGKIPHVISATLVNNTNYEITEAGIRAYARVGTKNVYEQTVVLTHFDSHILSMDGPALPKTITYFRDFINVPDTITVWDHYWLEVVYAKGFAKSND